MPATPDDRSDETGPIGQGLIALVAFGIGIALVLGIGGVLVLKASGVLGSGAGSSGTAQLVIPSFTPEPDGIDPIVLPSVEPTAAPTSTDSYDYTQLPGQAGETPTDLPTYSPPAGGFPINLQAGETTVTVLLDLSGTYPKGEGAVLQIQRLSGKTWVDFAPAGQTGQFVVTGGLFSGSITPDGTGTQTYRVRNMANGAASNPISVVVQ